MSNAITVQGIYACATVADFDAGVDWYTKLMGRAPDDRPMPGLAQWRNMGAAGLQVWHDAGRAGKAMMTIVVPVMDAERTRLAAAGIELAPDYAGDFGIVVQLQDPEGNTIALTEPPKGFVNR